jgi:hypothetical protein
MSYSKGLIVPVLYAHIPKLGPDMTRVDEDCVSRVLPGRNGLTAGSLTRLKGASDSFFVSIYSLACLVTGQRA